MSPALSYGCAHDLRCEERANELLNTPGMQHVCSGWACVPDPEDARHGHLAPCSCLCHAPGVRHEPVTPQEEPFLA